MPSTTDITRSEGKHGTRNVVTLPPEGDGVFIGSWAVRADLRFLRSPLTPSPLLLLSQMSVRSTSGFRLQDG